MRHRNSINKLSRSSDHRKALINNLMREVIEHGSIVTTLPKARVARSHLEKLITKGKAGDLSARRLVFSYLKDKKLTNKLVDEISKTYKDRPGGYTRILKMGKRRGDASEIAIFQLVKDE